MLPDGQVENLSDIIPLTDASSLRVPNNFISGSKASMRASRVVKTMAGDVKVIPNHTSRFLLFFIEASFPHL